MSYVARYEAKKFLTDFFAKHPSILPQEERYFFGLLKRVKTRSFDELICSGEITPKEADEVQSAQLLLNGW